MSAPLTITYNRQTPAPELVERLAEHLMIGGLAVVPTDTVYALIGDATAEPAAQAIFQLKNRAEDQALPVFVDDARSLERWYIRLRPKYRPLAEAFWPGALILVLPVWPGFYLRVGGDGKSVGVRATLEPIIYKVMRKANRYVYATSANPTGVEPAACDIAAWLESSENGQVMWLKPEDSFAPGPVSSVVDLTGTMPLATRIGAIAEDRLKKVVPDLQVRL
jgi:tRNA threonylcarbamoyl adenosine modification protein (Sua5/YciO/YrdC/YwlC family)